MTDHIILFDIGNVIIDWQPIRLYRQIFPDQQSAEDFLTEVCTMDWHVEHDRGRSFAEGAKILKAQFPQYADEIDAWRDRWWDMFDGYVDGMPPLIGRLEEAGHPMFGLSNMSQEVWPETCDRFPMLKVLREVLVSGKVGLVKPEPAIYEATHDMMGCPDKDNVFFIDDSLKNVDAARDFGFRAHHFLSSEGLEKALIEEGFLASAA